MNFTAVQLPDISRFPSTSGVERRHECTWKATWGWWREKTEKKKMCRNLADGVSDGRMGRSERLKEKSTDCRETRQTPDRRSPHSITSDQPHITHLIYLSLLSALPLRLFPPFLRLPSSPRSSPPRLFCFLLGHGCLVESEGSGCVCSIMFWPRQGAWNTCFGSLLGSLKYLEVGQRHSWKAEPWMLCCLYYTLLHKMLFYILVYFRLFKEVLLFILKFRQECSLKCFQISTLFYNSFNNDEIWHFFTHLPHLGASSHPFL